MVVFSIIVPVFQVEEYLPICLDSLVNQDYSDIEIICVNDGSTDKSRLILSDYAAIDPRIKIIDQENKGLSSARNTGVKAAHGKYLMFVDSDDFIETSACSTLKLAFEQSNADIVTFGGRLYPPGSVDRWVAKTISPRNALYTSFEPGLLFREKTQPYVWRVAFTKSFLDRTGLFFDEGIRFGEDAVFLFMAYPQSSCTKLIPNKLYHYRVSRNDSLMAVRLNQLYKKTRDHIRIVERILYSWEELGILDDYAVDLFTWIIWFLCYDIAVQIPANQTSLLNEVNHVIAPFYEKNIKNINKLDLGSRIILNVVNKANNNDEIRIRWSQLQVYRLYYLLQHLKRR